jgi:hypothetical protein
MLVYLRPLISSCTVIVNILSIFSNRSGGSVVNTLRQCVLQTQALSSFKSLSAVSVLGVLSEGAEIVSLNLTCRAVLCVRLFAPYML